MIYKLCDGSSEYLIDLFSSDRNWQVARSYFIKKGYRGKYLLIGETKTGFRVWNVDLHEPHGKGGYKPPKLIPVTLLTDFGTTEQFYTAKDIVRERNELRCSAYETLSTIDDNTVKHIVYYADERNENDEIVHAYLYPFLPLMTEEAFCKWADQQKGLVGAVHRL